MKIQTCRGCDANIIFIKSPKGKWLPIDARPATVYQLSENEPPEQLSAHIPHHITCPKADQYRKGRS